MPTVMSVFQIEAGLSASVALTERDYDIFNAPDGIGKH